LTYMKKLGMSSHRIGRKSRPGRVGHEIFAIGSLDLIIFTCTLSHLHLPPKNTDSHVKESRRIYFIDQQFHHDNLRRGSLRYHLAIYLFTSTHFTLLAVTIYLLRQLSARSSRVNTSQQNPYLHFAIPPPLSTFEHLVNRRPTFLPNVNSFVDIPCTLNRLALTHIAVRTNKLRIDVRHAFGASVAHTDSYVAVARWTSLQVAR
jgi:hypothetical protein